MVAGNPDSQPFARRYSGFLNALAAGTYTFLLSSDDGSLLWLDGNPMAFIDDDVVKSGACGETLFGSHA